jgi:hypothetical protein
MKSEFSTAQQETGKETLAKIEAVRYEFQSQLEEVQDTILTRTSNKKQCKRGEATDVRRYCSWTVFRRQFETVAKHNRCTRQEKATYMTTALQGRATDVLHGIRKGATNEGTLQALEVRHGNQHFAATYRSQTKERTWRATESLQDFATAIEQLAHRTYPTLPEGPHTEGNGESVCRRVEDPGIKMYLILGVEKTSNKVFRQALELHAVLIVTRPQKTNNGAIRGSRSPLTWRGYARRT